MTPLLSRTNMFGFDNRDWKPWTLNGLDVLVPEDFRVTVEPEKGGILIYPKGDTSVRPRGHMPKDAYFFDRSSARSRSIPTTSTQTTTPSSTRS